jgi:hypothetical protein
MKYVVAFKRMFTALGLVLALTMGFTGFISVNQASAQTTIAQAFCLNLFNRGLITADSVIINPETFEADLAAAAADYPPLRDKRRRGNQRGPRPWRLARHDPGTDS